MAWEPKNKIIDTRPLIENLLDFIRTKQVEAFLYANPVNGLKPFAGVYNSAEGRVIDVFPNLLVISDRIQTPPFAGDVIATTWTVDLEIALEGSDATKLTIESRKYEYALRSVLNNITGEDLLADATAVLTNLDVPDSVFDALGKGVKSKHAQVFQMRAEYKIQAAAY